MRTQDIMAGFELFQPNDLKAAFALLERFGPDAWKLAGGHDSLTWFKSRARRPKAVIDLSAIPGLAGVREVDGAIEIGALTTLTAVEANPLIKARYRILCEAAGVVASPQIRNTGTIGGNVAQRARCWYFRAGLPCWRAGGDGCFAQNTDSVNREHAIFDRGDCVAVNPSDIAPALVALDAEFIVESARGRRVVDAETFFVGVDTSVSSFNALRPGDILTAIRLPATFAGAPSYFEKVADRRSWDFALVSIASTFRMEGSAVADARLVCGGVSALPRRFPAAETMLKGKAPDATLAGEAGKRAVEDAKPLSGNGYKVPLVENLVARAIRDARK